MPLLNPTFLLGVLVLLYLSSFVIFAIIRIITGLSIQRIGYFSLRRLAYTPRDGVLVEVRGLGFSVHRPTFAQPTWLSLVLNELVVTIDLQELDGHKATEDGSEEGEKDDQNGDVVNDKQTPKSQPRPSRTNAASRSETWKKLTDVKEKIKKLHRKVKWLRMVDVVATNSTINVAGVGNIQVGSLTIAVDTRRKMVDRARFFFQRSTSKGKDRQAEWIIAVRSVLFTADGNESLEVLDHALLNIHGYLYESRDGLRDATVALKLGRVHVPLDDLDLCRTRYKRLRRQTKTFQINEPVDIFLGEVVQEGRESTSTTENLMRTVTDSKEFFSSLLRGIKEVQFAVSFVGLTKNIDTVRPAAVPMQLTAAMKEVGIDLHRLDSRSPAHRMYFPSKDVAHEALAAALSISVGLDDGHGKPERLVYIPMATTTVRTTLPSKTVELPQDGSVEEKNANIMFANSVVTSASVDLDPRHLPLLIAIMRGKPKPPRAQQEKRRTLISRFLPKASIKFSMHEPVIRIKLKPLQKTDDPDDFDLIISSISSISLDVESSHSPVENSHYSLTGAMRLQSHQLYYQTNDSERFNLITTNSFDLKVQLTSNPDVSVDANGNIQSFSISMIRPEITDGLRQIVQELRMDVEPEKRTTTKGVRQQNFLRSIPTWLTNFQIEATDVNIEVAGVDDEVSDDTRGVSVHLDALSCDYREHKLEGVYRRLPRTRTHSRSITQSDSDMTPPPYSPKSKRKLQNVGDGRRLGFNAKGIEAQILESVDRLESVPFVHVPRLEMAFSASSDAHGPMFHIQTLIRTIHFKYSLYRHYSVGVAVMTLRRAFMKTGQDMPRQRQHGTATTPSHLVPPSPHGMFAEADSMSKVPVELVTVDVKASLVQIKAEMPNDPVMMVHIYGLETGRHRWSTPYLASKLIRLYVEPPRMRNVWARVVSIKAARIDWRTSKRKTIAHGFIEEKMIDISSEAIRIGIPHEVVVNKITDNFVNVFKAVQQLHHRFKTGTNEYILEKLPEGPKLVPKVSLRTRSFLFELEDGAFEWKLGMIYRTGRVEQMQRIAREEAFRAKMKRVRDEESRKGNSKVRSRSAFARGRGEQASGSWFRTRSLDAVSPPDSRQGPAQGRIPRYNPEAEHLGINGHAKVAEEEARLHLNMYNAQTWRKRIDRAYEVSQAGVKDTRSAFWGATNLPDEYEETENILEVPQRPALMSTMITDLRVIIDKPTFALSELPQFLNKVGKGMPIDMEYGLLIPMHISIDMDEAKITLRDYPLPLLHIPALKTGQSSKAQAVSIKTNFVIAEEYRGVESTRRVRVNIVPPKDLDPSSSNEGSFAIEVRRTIGPVKSFSEVHVDINTALPTRITWAPCYQPAIQDLMMAVESFTKPQVDPSERVGFWDKLRLVFHSRLFIAWKGDGDMHLALKGTRDPYHVIREGAGFLMCWRNDVRWSINTEDDPKRFMMVDSGEYVLAVPDYSHQVRDASRRMHGEDRMLGEDSTKAGAIFKKVVMKLSGKVQWMAGLTFERAIENKRRSFEFRPHYDIVLKNPIHARPEGGLPYDAMRGFRSRHIHLSIAVRAPADRQWMSDKPEPSRSYNTVHLTPRFFTHFFAWWGLFSQPTSLPIRQGNLFPGREKNSKKFGRHLATVKYSLLLAPLYLSHIYKHKDVEDYSEDAVSATGLKVRFDSFMLDLHQRREEFNTLGRGKSAQSRTTGIKIHAAQLDLVSADLRAVSASLKGTTTEAIKRGSISALITDQNDKPDLKRFTIPDHDYSWIDMDDFVELDWILPTEPHPHTQILPLAYAPRLTYFRQTDIGGTIAGDPTRTSPFGDEPTHDCIMSNDDDPKKVQAQLIEERLQQLVAQMQTHARNVGEAELKVIKSNSRDEETVEDYEALRKHTSVLREKKAFLESMLYQMNAASPPHTNLPGTNGNLGKSDGKVNIQNETMHIPSAAEFESEFKNRFVVHNAQLKWNNLLRNIVLRYIHQNSQRRGFIYYLSRPAIKFILDIVEEQNRARTSKSKATNGSGARGNSPDPHSATSEKHPDQDLEDRLKDILGQDRKNTNTTFNSNSDGVATGTIEDLGRGISDDFSPQSSYHIRLIAPQIQMQSDKNKKNVVLVTAKGMELKVMEVMDKERISDNVSGLVQRRFLVSMDSTQFFVTHKKWFFTNLVSMYAGNKYGTPSGLSWPPWVPMEVMFDFQTAPFGFRRVVQKTSGTLRYDKYNTLRLKYNDEVNAEDTDADSKEKKAECRLDNLWVEFPQARALCNSSQYYAMYVIVLDLLMYSEPLEKTRTERLEKIMLASDFSDLSGAPQKIHRLQERIRQMEEIKVHFQVWSKYLDVKGWEDRLALERDLAACEDELFFVMKAITTSQRKFDVNAESNALLKWSISARDIVWHLMQDSHEALVELQLKDVQYDRTDNSDGSHVNLVRVGKVLGLNLLPDAMFPEIIAPYQDQAKGVPDNSNDDMIRVYWHMLEAIAGIPVMDRFEIELFPVKVQLEREVGKRLFEYIFPGMDSEKPSAVKTESPLILKAEPEEEDDETMISSISRQSTPSMDKDSSGFSTRAGSLELRLRPTLTSNAAPGPPKRAFTMDSKGDGSHFRLFRHGGGPKPLGKKASADSLRVMHMPKPIGRTSTGLSSKDGRDSTTGDHKKRFGLRGKLTDDKHISDDLTQMIDRASNYMTFAVIKMPSVVLCLSYKGKETRNIEDVHDFVFRLPAIEWQNKTWSNMDLVLAVKKAVIKALISHTGAIIGNKISRHHPNAEQRTKQRELASSSVLNAPSTSNGSQQYAGSINESDESASLYETSPVDFSRSPPRSIRGSTHSSIPAPHSTSRSSSIASGRSYRNDKNGPTVPSYLTMTPPTPIEGRRGSNHAIGIDVFGPSSRTSTGLSTLRDSRPTTADSQRPQTSSSDAASKSDRRRSAAGGFRDRITAFTHRMSHRESSTVPEEERESEEEESPGRMLKLVTGRTKTGVSNNRHGSKERLGKRPKRRRQQLRSPTSPQHKHIIAIKDFIPLAEHIRASTKPAVCVPKSLITTIERVIKVRSGFGTQLAEQNVETTPAVDRTHSYFVEVLQRVLEILRPGVVAAFSRGQEKTSKERPPGKSAGLKVHEPSEDFLNAPDVERPAKTEDDPNSYEAEQNVSYEEAFLGYGMMINDLLEIRRSIRWIWNNQLQGKLDLAAAAVATNTAIDLARGIMDGILPLLQNHGGSYEIACTLYIGMAKQKGYGDADLFTQGKVLKFDETYHVADGMFFGTFTILTELPRFLNGEDGLPPLVNEAFTRITSGGDLSKMTGKEKFMEDASLIMESFAEVMILGLCEHSNPARDEYARGILQLKETGAVPFHLVFAAQIFLDVHHVMRNAAQAPVDYVLMVLAASSDNVSALITSFKDVMSGDPALPVGEGLLNRVLEIIHSVSSDDTRATKLGEFDKRGLERPPSMPQHRLLKQSPLMCGLVLFQIRYDLHLIGIGEAGARHYVVSTAHLYNALWQEGLIKGKWADMEVVVSLLGEGNFFVGNRPADLEGYLNRFHLQMGMTASATLARERLGDRLKMRSKAGPRRLKSDPVVSSMFKLRYLEGKGGLDWTSELIENVVLGARMRQGAPELEYIVYLIRENSAYKSLWAREAAKHKVQKGACLSPGLLVKILALNLQYESAELGFPYLVFHRVCRELLRSLKSHVDELICKTVGPYMRSEKQLFMLTSFIFAQAQRHDPNLLGDESALELAAEVFNKFIAGGAADLMVRQVAPRTGLDMTFLVGMVPRAVSDNNEAIDGHRG